MSRRHTVKLQLDGQSIRQWLDAPATTHVQIEGVTLSREQLIEFERIGRTGGAPAQARYLEQHRSAA